MFNSNQLFIFDGNKKCNNLQITVDIHKKITNLLRLICNLPHEKMPSYLPLFIINTPVYNNANYKYSQI